MIKKWQNNVVDHKIYDGGVEIINVQEVVLPSIEFNTTDFTPGGIAGDLTLPNFYKLKAMTISVKHNGGSQNRELKRLGRHNFEFRLAVQELNGDTGELEAKAVKYRVGAVLTSTSDDKVSRDNPISNESQYSVLTYQEEIDGEIVTDIDILADKIMINGVTYTDKIAALLDN